MVESQLRTNKVSNTRLLKAFQTVPREAFLPEVARGIAYIDEDIHIGGQRFMMEPMVLARLVQAAEIAPSDIVLEIGGATGYATAILARLAATVVALETDIDLAGQAARSLAEQAIDNVVSVEGSLTEGHPEQAPYNVILFNGAVAKVPGAITEQLAEGGRLVAVVKERGGLGRATLMRRVGAVVSSRVLFDAGTPILPGFEQVARFEF
jgi:protein-L-isoaspartate(D-aspartate) O-methyltransferase